MHKSNMSPCTGQGVSSTNKIKLVSFNCVFADLPVSRVEKTMLRKQQGSWEIGLDTGQRNVRCKGASWQGR